MKKIYILLKFICSVVVILFTISASAGNYQKLKIKISEKTKVTEALKENEVSGQQFSNFKIITGNLNMESGDSVEMVGAITKESEVKYETLLNRNISNPELVESDESLNIFPNPLSTSARIRYRLNADAKVKLVVFNMFGHQMKLLVDEIQSEGMHTVKWDVSDESGKVVPTGIYICRMLKNGKVTQVTRIVVNR